MILLPKPKPSSLHHLHLPKTLISTTTTTLHPQTPQNLDSDEKTISTLFHLITTSPTPSTLSSSLPSPLHSLSPSLIHSLFLRLRFSHANPLRSLHFFHLLPPHLIIPSSFDTMLYILSRSRNFQQSFSLLKTHHYHSLISHKTLHILLSRVAKVSSLQTTLQTFRKFKKLLHPFDTAAFNCLLRTLCQEKTMHDARSVYHLLKHEFKPNLVTFNTLLSGWKGVEDAEGFFEEMRELGIEPDLVTYNCLIDVYCKNREVGKARKVFDEMREREIDPDVISYTSLIGGLGLIGQPDKAREVLKEMREAGCYPDVAAYNAAIRNFCIAKRMKCAFGLMEEMKVGAGLVPNATSYNLFFRVFYWANNLESAWRLYGRMMEEGCLPNTQSCMFLVRLCRRQEKVEMALRLWGDMVEKGFGSFTLVSDVLFDLLCDFGKLDEAEKCFGEMVEKGQKPSNVSFRRIRVLMELAKRDESIQKLEEMMAMFWSSDRVAVDKVNKKERSRKA